MVPAENACQLVTCTGAGGSSTVSTLCGLKNLSVHEQSKMWSEPALATEFDGHEVQKDASAAPAVVLKVLTAQSVQALDFVGAKLPAKHVWHVVAELAPK
jgi:hypothetical protein